MQGLLYWGGVGHHKVVANRISESSSILPGAPITYVNSVAVAPNGKVYFTASGDIPPPYQQGAYNTKLAAEYIALEVLSHLIYSDLLNACKYGSGFNIVSTRRSLHACITANPSIATPAPEDSKEKRS